MTDRELLKAAAKAAGRVLMYEGSQAPDPLFWREGANEFPTPWKPLTDDGDALRLAVKLRLEVDVHHTGIAVRTPSGIKVLIDAEEIPDAYAATRRAIVRAAAAMAVG